MNEMYRFDSDVHVLNAVFRILYTPSFAVA